MTKPRAIWVCAIVLGTGILVGSACTIRTGPPPEPQPTATATPTPAPAPTPAPTPTPTTPPAATTSAPTASVPPAASSAPKYDACAGKKCGDRCNICPPHTPGCFETALVKMCHPDGLCKPATTVDCAKK
jgi:hypothetical protein